MCVKACQDLAHALGNTTVDKDEEVADRGNLRRAVGLHKDSAVLVCDQGWAAHLLVAEERGPLVDECVWNCTKTRKEDPPAPRGLCSEWSENTQTTHLPITFPSFLSSSRQESKGSSHLGRPISHGHKGTLDVKRLPDGTHTDIIDNNCA